MHGDLQGVTYVCTHHTDPLLQRLKYFEILKILRIAFSKTLRSSLPTVYKTCLELFYNLKILLKEI